MLTSRESVQASRLALLEGALLSLLRDAEDDLGVDGLSITAEVESGQVVIDLTYTSKGLPITGQSL